MDRLIRALLEAQGRDAGVLDAATGSMSASAGELRFLPPRSVGDVWALWQLWQSLELDGLALAWSRSRITL